ncbi:MAG: hypothetical protein PHC56_09810 [Herbinix sp.]|nr:hypothetical protein [Herbinix sp.]
MLLNKAQADALCAIIALGFVGQNEREDRTDRPIYLYNSEDDRVQHQKLATILKDGFGIDIAVNLQNAKDAVTNRKVHPFIYALPYGNIDEPRMLTYDEVKVNEEEILDVVQITETAINSLIAPSNRFRGAYVGGFIDYKEGKISLIGPSSLYLRERMYLNLDSPSPESVSEMFIEFANVTRETKKFLKECSPSFHTRERVYGDIVIAPDLTEAMISEAQPGDDRRILDEGKIFASCHGLITSMYYHSDVGHAHLDDGVCIELSLSNDTCKSASCIPCAIFAASQGAPASAVHFGRGDFWNLPAITTRESLNPKLENCRSFVIDCFTAASLEILERGDFDQTTMQMGAMVRNQADLVAIPEMFLDALTFEGAFITKMTSYLQKNH